jgi:type II secretory pathway component HofQ
MHVHAPFLSVCGAGALALVLNACASTEEARERVFGPTVPERQRRSAQSTGEPEIAPAAQSVPAGGQAQPERTPPREPPHIGDDVPRELELRGAALSEALHLIASMAGLNIYLDADLSQAVDASFPSVTLDDALSVLLARNGLELVEEPPGVYWVTRNDGSEAAMARFQLGSANGADLVENLKALVGSDTVLVVDPDQNFLIVRGRQRDVDAVGEYLSGADRLKRQVLIEVEILEVDLSDEFQLGLLHALSDDDLLGDAALDVSADFSTNAGQFLATITSEDGTWTTTINALRRYGVVNVLSSPRVLALSNTPAKIDVVTEIPYIDTSTSITGGGGTTGTTSQQTVAFKEAGIKLMVTPVIQADGVVQLAIQQEFSEVVDFFNGIPVLDKRNVDTKLLVRERESVALGGLIQSRRQEEDTGIPVLMHLPLLGRLFRSDEDRGRRRELLVLLTPRILDPSQANDLARTLRHDFQARARASGAPAHEER